jgi:hypothetical protein
VVCLSALRASHALPPQNDILVRIFVRDSVKVIMRLEELSKIKEFKYLIVNRIRDLPACSIMPGITYYDFIQNVMSLLFPFSQMLFDVDYI